MAALLAQPNRFGFDAVLRVLMHARRTQDPAQAAQFRTAPARALPTGEVTSVVHTEVGRKPRVTVAMIGLIGTGGVLPRLYENLAAASLRRGSAALHDFVDLLSHRMVAFFGQAGIKYRLHRSAETASLGTAPDPIGRAVLALTGHGTANLVERLEAGADPLLHYAGLFATRPRSADRLAALVSDWLGQPVEVRQFAGSWLPLPREQRTTLPGPGLGGSWNRLGDGAVLGIQSWDPHARIVLRIGPLHRAAFEALLPDQLGHHRLVSLVQAFLGLETGFAINPVLAATALSPLALDRLRPGRLGWNTWISRPGAVRGADAPDARFEAAQ
jgi:type VI secretion system protein ImpH